MLETTRKKDSIVEKEINAFNDKHLYGNTIKFQRETSREKQLCGVDGYITVESENIFNAPCDEKASGQYVNRPIPTFLMELSQITMKGEEVDGWFLGENDTEYYMLMYVWAEVPQTIESKNLKAEWGLINQDNLSLTEYFLVKKQDIMDYLESCGFNKNRLKEGVKYLRNNTDQKKVKTKYGFDFVISRQLKECPVNLCIRRDVYKKICIKHGYAQKYDYGV